MGALSPTHWLIVVGIIALLFGANRLPQVARGMGQSLRILRSEVRELDAESVPATGVEADGEGGQSKSLPTATSGRRVA